MITWAALLLLRGVEDGMTRQDGKPDKPQNLPRAPADTKNVARQTSNLFRRI